MICVSLTTVWSQHGKLGCSAIFTLQHFLTHAKMQWKMQQRSGKCCRKFCHIPPHSAAFCHIPPHSATFHHILPHSATFCHIHQNLATRGHGLRHLRHDCCCVFNRLLQKRQRLHSNLECGCTLFHVFYSDFLEATPEL
jgi:hypothetical protein